MASNKHHLLKFEMLALIGIIFIAGFAGGYLTSRLRYKTDLLETRLMVGQQAEKVTIAQQTLAVRSINGGAMMRNNQMYTVSDDVISPMKTEVRTNDGSVVHPDGKVIRSDKSSFVLTNGRGIDSSGRIVIIDPEE